MLNIYHGARRRPRPAFRNADRSCASGERVLAELPKWTWPADMLSGMRHGQRCIGGTMRTGAGFRQSKASLDLNTPRLAGRTLLPLIAIATALVALSGCGLSNTRTRTATVRARSGAAQTLPVRLTASQFARLGTDVLRVALLFPTESQVQGSLPAPISAAASEAAQECGSATIASKCLVRLAAQLAQVPLQSEVGVGGVRPT